MAKNKRVKDNAPVSAPANADETLSKSDIVRRALSNAVTSQSNARHFLRAAKTVKALSLLHIAGDEIADEAYLIQIYDFIVSAKVTPKIALNRTPKPQEPDQQEEPDQREKTYQSTSGYEAADF